MPKDDTEDRKKQDGNSPQLNADSLKSALWTVLNGVKDGNMEPGQADAVASQAREILRTLNVQLRVSQQAKRPVPTDVIHFSENT